MICSIGTPFTRVAGSGVGVRRDVGDEACLGMAAGSLVLGNSTGDRLGLGMLGGTIYVRGAIKSLAAGIRENRMKDSDTMRLSLLLLSLIHI